MAPVSMTLSDLYAGFQGNDIIQRQITRKRCKLELKLQSRTNRKSYMVCRTAPFSMILNDLKPRFQGQAIFDAEYLRNGYAVTVAMEGE